MIDPPGLGDRLAAIRAAIAAAAQRAGRDPGSITLVGASKNQPVERLREAHAAGLRDFGENRVQEAGGKRPQMPADTHWHLLGPLQSNKVGLACDLFTTFHAVDRPRIAERLEAELARRGEHRDAFVEVNLGGESSKHGFPPDELAVALRPLAAFAHLRIVGLMTIPPPSEDPEAARPWFRRLRELRDALRDGPPWRDRLDRLSMGMSDDFAVAVEEGATHVRVGTALFGPRPPAAG